MFINTTNPSSSSMNPLLVTDTQLVTAVNAALSPPQSAISVGGPWPIVAATPSGSGGGSTSCTGSPKIGNLCGRDATGAYIGIALGSATVLALMAAALAYALRSPPVPATLTKTNGIGQGFDEAGGDGGGENDWRVPTMTLTLASLDSEEVGDGSRIPSTRVGDVRESLST